MGATVNARCGCGLNETNLMIGGGMLNFQTFCSFPVLCRKCAALRLANLLAPCPVCGECGSEAVTPYDDPALRQGAGEQTVVSWRIDDRTLVLTDATYYCPTCRQFTLRFEPGDICWD